MKMSRRQFIVGSVGFLSGGAAFLRTGRAEEAARGATGKPPNILFVCTDDQARWALGAYANRDIHTPNMDRLAAEGMLFERAFVSTPVCSPSRCSGMTSLYSHQTGIHDWISPEEKDVGLREELVTIAELLQKGGYRTALFGKWHLGAKEEFFPTRHGFDYFMGFLGGGNRPKDPTLFIEGKEQKVEGFLTDILAEHAIRWLRDNCRGPFALFFHTRAPHMPYLPVPEQDSERYRNAKPAVPEVKDFDKESLRQLYRDYYSSISSVDRNLGRLLDELKQLGIEGTTIVIFTSDNGYMIGQHGLETKGNAWTLTQKNRKRRPNMFDDSIMVPLIVRWPGVVKPGSRRGEMVAEIDHFPTLLEAAGIRKPEGLNIEGSSTVPLLRGQMLKWRDALFGSYDMHHGAEAHMRMIRTDSWKLIRHYEKGVGDELYDLRNDPGELRNLAAEERSKTILGELKDRLTAWQRRTNDPLAAREAVGEECLAAGDGTGLCPVCCMLYSSCSINRAAAKYVR